MQWRSWYVVVAVCSVASVLLSADKRINQAPEVPSSPAKNRWECFADFLWWQGDVEGTEVVASGPLTLLSDSSGYNCDFDISAPTGTWEPGMRLGAGYQFEQYDAWKVEAFWTFIFTASDGVDLSTAGSNRRILPLGPNPLGPNAAQYHAQWWLRSNLADVQLGREFFPTTHLALKPHLGVRGGFFQFKLHHSALGQWSALNSSMQGPPTTMYNPTWDRNQFQYNGIGFRIGNDTAWHIANHWTIMGNIAGSLLYGKYNNRESFLGYTPNAENDGGPALIRATGVNTLSSWNVRTNVELYLGICWDRCWGKQKHIALSAGYELAAWFLLNNLYSLIDGNQIFFAWNGATELYFSDSYFTGIAANSNITYQGLTARVALDF